VRSAAMDRGAASEEGIENQGAAGRAIENGIGHQRHRFYRGMQGEQVTLGAGAGE